MLADPTGVLSRAFGVMIEEEGMAYRGTFLVNPEGKIKIAEIQDNNIGRNADELLRKVEAAQFVATHDGEVCPAKWKKGVLQPLHIRDIKRLFSYPKHAINHVRNNHIRPGAERIPAFGSPLRLSHHLSSGARAGTRAYRIPEGCGKLFRQALLPDE